MIEAIMGIEAQGKGYVAKRRFDVFKKVKKDGGREVECRVALLYGRNGSGKTTLAAAFKAANPADADSQLSVALVKQDGTTVPLAECDESLKKAIAVFDEKYVGDKIWLKSGEKGIGTIILFSDLIDIDKQIASVKRAKDDAIAVVGQLDQELLAYVDHKNIRSPQYHLDRIVGELKNTWAEDMRKARGLSKKQSVNENLALEIARMKCRTAAQDIAKETAACNDKLVSLARIGDVANIPPVAELSLVGFDEAAFLRLLNRRVEKPVLNEREKRIMELLEGEHGDRIGEVSEVFRDSATAYCPYCFRDIAATEKTTLVEGVEKVLNRTVEEYREELKSVVFPDFSFDYERYEVVDPEIAQEAKAAVDTCVAIVGLYREDVVAKEGNVYGVSDIPGRGLSAAVAVANEKLRLVEEKRVNAAAMAKRKSDIELDLFRLYKEKAHYGVQKDYAAYERQMKESADKRRVRDELSRAAEAKQAELDALESKKAGTDIAVDCINESLRYIFADKDRFTVEPKNGEYVLKSRGHDVCPADVSTGERHILALAYFFVDIMANHAKKDFYKDERVLVIDDPVSSYDQENRIGVYSFLMRMMRKVLVGNVNSRILLMTHDLYTIIGLKRASEMLKRNCPETPDFEICCFEMWPDALSDFGFRKRNEYGLLLNDVYQFSKEGSIINSLTIGNEMRRVLEAYSSFLYRMDFTDLVGEKFAARLEGLGQYLMSRIDRLVLNDESHMEDRARSVAADGTFFAVIDDNEKRQTARDVLCLLYLLDPLHVSRHFETCGQTNHNQVEKDIKNWIQERKGKLAGDGSVKVEGV